MNNPAQKYRSVMIKALIKILAKAAFLQEQYTIFPFISKLNFNNIDSSAIYLYWKNLIKKKHFESIQSILQGYYSEQEIDSLISISLKEVLETLKEVPLGKINSDLLFLDSLSVFDVEESNFPELINSDKYKLNTFYLERYIRFIDNPNNPILSGRDNKFRDVVTVSNAQLFMEGLISNLPNTNSLFLNIQFGLRLMYLPVLSLSNNQILQLKNDNSVVLSKINLIQSKFEEDGEFFTFHPLLVCEATQEFPLSLIDIVNVLNLGQTNNDVGLEIKKRTSDTKLIMRNVSDFKKVFEYALPLISFEIILVLDLIKKYQLVHEVFKDNKIFSNFADDIIKVIDHLVNAENPSKL